MANATGGSGPVCADCGAPAIGVTVSGPTVADQRPFCARHSPAETDRQADEIRRLRTALHQAWEALEPFQLAADRFRVGNSTTDTWELNSHTGLRYGDLGKARDALAAIAEVLPDEE